MYLENKGNIVENKYYTHISELQPLKKNNLLFRIKYLGKRNMYYHDKN